MQDAWRAYLELALGVTEASKKKAQKVAQKLVGKGGATASQLQALTEDLLAAGGANREAIVKLVRHEVERNLGRLGLASADEVAALNEKVRELEERLLAARGETTSGTAETATETQDDFEADSEAGRVGTASTGPDIGATETGDETAGSGFSAKKPAGTKAVVKKAVVKKAAKKATVAPTTAAKSTTAKSTTAEAASGQQTTAAKATKATKATKAVKAAKTATAAREGRAAGSKRTGSR